MERIVFSFALTPDDAESLRRVAESLGVKRGAVLRLAVRALGAAAAGWPSMPVGDLHARAAVEPRVAETDGGANGS